MSRMGYPEDPLRLLSFLQIFLGISAIEHNGVREQVARSEGEGRGEEEENRRGTGEPRDGGAAKIWPLVQIIPLGPSPGGLD